MNTGKYRWHYQTVHHDIWDYDTAANPLVAFDLTIKGKPRNAIASMGKTGWIYMLDRRTGKPILGIREKKVPQSPVQHTYPTQPIPVGQPFAAQCAAGGLEELEGSGRQAGEGRLHLHAVQLGGSTRRSRRLHSAASTGRRPATARGRGTCTSARRTARRPGRRCRRRKSSQLKPLGNFFQIEGLSAQKGSPAVHAQGKVVAMNMRTNRRAWTAAFPTGDICYSGILSTAGGLVFVGRNNQTLQAYDDTHGQAPLDLAQARRERRGAADDLPGRRQAVRRRLRRR